MQGRQGPVSAVTPAKRRYLTVKHLVERFGLYPSLAAMTAEGLTLPEIGKILGSAVDKISPILSTDELVDAPGYSAELLVSLGLDAAVLKNQLNFTVTDLTRLGFDVDVLTGLGVTRRTVHEICHMPENTDMYIAETPERSLDMNRLVRISKRAEIECVIHQGQRLSMRQVRRLIPWLCRVMKTYQPGESAKMQRGTVDPTVNELAEAVRPGWLAPKSGLCELRARLESAVLADVDAFADALAAKCAAGGSVLRLVPIFDVSVHALMSRFWPDQARPASVVHQFLVGDRWPARLANKLQPLKNLEDLVLIERLGWTCDSVHVSIRAVVKNWDHQFSNPPINPEQVFNPDYEAALFRVFMILFVLECWNPDGDETRLKAWTDRFTNVFALCSNQSQVMATTMAMVPADSMMSRLMEAFDRTMVGFQFPKKDE